ncbi:DnaJ-domain-containing protein [Annulohypoxylon bovei var. microspora]|nr:DnaJ-domain-containing protein [Annulohypoxylon bovei var. microspora]
MPSLPSFDLYATLEVEHTATSSEITTSYRRLALIHHPDKNPGNQEAATEAFQKVQLAYEILSNPEKRSHYDARSSARSAPSSSGSQDPYYDPYEPNDEDLYDIFGNFFFRFRTAGFRHNFPFRRSPSPDYDLEEAIRRAREEAIRKDAERLAELREQLRVKAEAEEARKKAKDDARQAELDSKNKAKEALQAVEKSKQEERWKTLGAQTKDDRLITCLHSEFCTKTQQRQKFKCGACKVKRGITAFECPYCSIFICQQCVFDFAKKRIKAEEQPVRQPDPVADPQPAGNPVFEAKNDSHDKKDPNTKPKGGQGRGKKYQGPPRCYRCQKLGHLAKFCGNRPEGQSSTSGDKKNWKGKPHADGKAKGQGQGQQTV